MVFAGDPVKLFDRYLAENYSPLIGKLEQLIIEFIRQPLLHKQTLHLFTSSDCLHYRTCAKNKISRIWDVLFQSFIVWDCPFSRHQ